MSAQATTAPAPGRGAWLAEKAVRLGLAAWVIVALGSLAGAALAGTWAMKLLCEQHLDRLDREVDRTQIELLTQTSESKVMGLATFLGLSSDLVRRDAMGLGQLNDPLLVSLLEDVCRSYDADGIFVLGSDGVVRSGWDHKGNISTGLNVRFRPYFQMAMQGIENVYPAVSQVQSERSLYLTSPVLNSNQEAQGAVAVRTNLTKIDGILLTKPAAALLLSPQGLVFASNQPQWLGMATQAIDESTLQTLRKARQFGPALDQKPNLLDLPVQPGLHFERGARHAVSSAVLSWNDPLGDWRIVLVEDLNASVPWRNVSAAALGGGLLVLVLGSLTVLMLRGAHQQRLASDQLRKYSAEQLRHIERKSRLALLAAALQQATSLAQTAQAVLSEARQSLGASHGNLYVCPSDSHDALQLAGSSACAEAAPEWVEVGVGLVGQCAADRRTLRLQPATENAWRLRSGLGEASPALLLVLPVQRQGALMGVLELAFLQEPIADMGEFLDEFLSLLAINLDILRRNLHTQAELAERLLEGQMTAEHLGFQQSLIDNIPFPVFYKGADTRFIGFNKAYETAFAVDRSTIIGKRVLDLEYLPLSDRQAYQAEDEAVIQSLGTASHLIYMPYADGSLRRTLYSVSGFRRGDGQPGGLVGCFVELPTAEPEPSSRAETSP